MSPDHVPEVFAVKFIASLGKAKAVFVARGAMITARHGRSNNIWQRTVAAASSGDDYRLVKSDIGLVSCDSVYVPVRQNANR